MAAHPTVNANEWSGCYWRMSPCFVANRSPCTCASVEAPARLLSCRSRRRLGSAGPHLQKLSRRSIGCWISILIKQSPFSSISTGYDRLREAGLLTRQEMAQALGVAATTIRIWRSHGLLRGHAYTDKGDYLYERPGEDAPRKALGLKLSLRSPCRSAHTAS